MMDATNTEDAEVTRRDSEAERIVRGRARGRAHRARGGGAARAAAVLAGLERARLRAPRSARARVLGNRAGNAVPPRRLVSQDGDHRDRLPGRPRLVSRRRAGALARPDLSQLRRRRTARITRVPPPRTRTQTAAPRHDLRPRSLAQHAAS